MIPGWPVSVGGIVQVSISIRFSFWLGISTSLADQVVSRVPGWPVSVGIIVYPSIGIRFTFWLSISTSLAN